MKKKICDSSVMFHTSKTHSQIIFSLQMYDCKHEDIVGEDGWYSGEIVEGTSLSVGYYNYKYGAFGDIEKLSADIASIIGSQKFIESINYIIPVPNYNSEKMKNLVKKISKKLDIEFLDVLTNNSKEYMKKIKISERSKKFDFISCADITNINGNILLIDDFVETGTTFRECVKAIKNINPNINITRVAIFRTHLTLEELE